MAIKNKAAFKYVMTYKPYDVVCVRRDRHGSRTLTDIGIPAGLHPAGRLDRDSEGLLLLTDDGDLFHRVTHPHFHHPKTYLALVIGDVTDDALGKLRDGVEIKFGMTKPADVEQLRIRPTLPPFPKPLPATHKTTWLRIVLYEGKNRQIRRMTGTVGLSTLRLVRVALGPLTLPADLQPGQWRVLNPLERRVLLNWVYPRRPANSRKRPYAAQRMGGI